MKKRTFREGLESIADIPSSMLYGGAHLTVKGRGEAVIFGCEEIKLYSEERIDLGMKGFTLSVTGKRLSCLSFCEGRIVITGLIESVLYTAHQANPRHEKAEE